MYESFFGLSASPFQLNPDPAFLFESKGHRRAHAYLQYGVFQGEGFIVITGEIGAGKTTLVRALLRELDAEKVVAAQLVSTQLEADDLLRSVAIAFGLPAKGSSKSELLGEIEGFLTSLVPRGKRALLVVDEAQNLGPRAMEELRMLSNFQIGERTLLQSFLVGQPELRDLMRHQSMQQLHQRIIASYHLGPLEEKETRAYIEHRLKNVGWMNDPALEDEAFAPIHRATGGIPRRINSLCSRLMLAAYLAERHRIGAANVEEAVAELREELGTNALPLEAQAVESGPASTREFRGGDVVRSLMVSTVTARLDRLERNVAILLELVRKIAGGDDAKPAATVRTGSSKMPGSGSGVRR